MSVILYANRPALLCLHIRVAATHPVRSTHSEPYAPYTHTHINVAHLASRPSLQRPATKPYSGAASAAGGGGGVASILARETSVGGSSTGRSVAAAEGTETHDCSCWAW